VGRESEGSETGEIDAPSGVFETPANILLLGSPMDAQTFEVGLSHLTASDSERTRVVWVTLLNTPREVVDLWDSHCQRRPDQFQVVLVGSELSVSDGVFDPALDVRTVSEPGDLTTLGVRVLNALSAVEGDENENVDLCLRFDSLTPLAQYVSQRGLVQFLHVLTTRLSNAGVRAHFHLDPMAHDSQLVHTLSSIFDAQIRVEGDEVSLTYR
jgi:hypothetical protein